LGITENTGGAWTYRVDPARDIRSPDVRHRDLERKALPGPQVQVIQPYGTNPDPDLSGPGIGDRPVLDPEDVGSSMFVENGGAHGQGLPPL